MGIGSLPSLSEIEVRPSVRGLFLKKTKHLWHFPMDVVVKNNPANSDKSLRCLYEENKSDETIQSLLINTVPAYMPIDEIPIVRSFLCSV